MTMLRFFALLTGDRFTVLNQHGPASRKKVIQMGMGLLLVTGLWTVTGYNVGLNILGLGQAQAFLIAAILGGLIFLVDRMIILSIGLSKGLAWMRLTLAVVMALLGATATDLVVLRSEIEQTLVDVHHEDAQQLVQRVEAQYMPELDAAKAVLAERRAALANAEREWKEEMNGSPAGSGRYGFGPVAKAKEQLVQQRRLDVVAAEDVLVASEMKRTRDIELGLVSVANAQQQPGLLERIHALHRYVVSDRYVLIGYLMLTLIVVLLELSPLAVKMCSATTAYERELELVDSMQQERVQAVAHIQRHIVARRAAMSEEERNALVRLKDVTTAYHRMN